MDVVHHKPNDHLPNSCSYPIGMHLYHHGFEHDIPTLLQCRGLQHRHHPHLEVTDPTRATVIPA